MPIILRKPTTDGQRGMSVLDFSDLTKKKPSRRLTSRISNTGGRNNTGRITVAHRGGGAKKIYRHISFKRVQDQDLEIKAIEYDPNRSANIALVADDAKKEQYILATTKMKPGQKIKTAGSIKDGNTVSLKDLPTATLIHNIEMKPGRGGQMCRAAGSYATFLGLDGKYALVKLPSGEVRKMISECQATVGVVGNLDHNKVVIGKAGRTRHMGIRPTVRGKAKNPVDHPHGGGEGNTSIGLKRPKTPWGFPTLGYRTRNRKRLSDKYIIKSRHKA